MRREDAIPLFDPSADYRTFDALETATLFRRLTTATFDTGSAVADCLRREATREELLAAGASLAKTGLVWRLWAAELRGGPAPKANDVVQDAAGVRYSVLAATSDPTTGQHQLTTIRER